MVHLENKRNDHFSFVDPRNRFATTRGTAEQHVQVHTGVVVLGFLQPFSGTGHILAV